MGNEHAGLNVTRKAMLGSEDGLQLDSRVVGKDAGDRLQTGVHRRVVGYQPHCLPFDPAQIGLSEEPVTAETQRRAGACGRSLGRFAAGAQEPESQQNRKQSDGKAKPVNLAKS